MALAFAYLFKISADAVESTKRFSKQYSVTFESKNSLYAIKTLLLPTQVLQQPYWRQCSLETFCKELNWQTNFNDMTTSIKLILHSLLLMTIFYTSCNAPYATQVPFRVNRPASKYFDIKACKFFTVISYNIRVSKFYHSDTSLKYETIFTVKT